jgi:CHAT domain-containing protein
VSSYTATMRALRPAPTPDPGRASLVVAVSATAGQADLPGARREAALIARRHPHARVLADADATRANAAALLPDAAWVHFACHAASRVTDPSASCLLLTDGPLTVLDVARMRSPGAYLAYLSACSTARGGTALPDEAIHISSAFQIAGYPHIIATLWPIADDIAADAADEVHARWTADGPAHALHDTTRRLRDSYNGRSPHLWAAHIHTGP